MKKYVISCFLAIGFLLPAQTVQLYFPHFAEVPYSFSIFQGAELDTIASGIVPSDGRLIIQIPEKYKGYRGMASWTPATGGGLALVISGEDFEVECLEPIPQQGNIFFTGSNENKFLRDNYYQQQSIFVKHDAILQALKAYDETDALYPVLENEMKAIKSEFIRFRKELQNTDLYAARFREISDAVSGIGSDIYPTETAQTAGLLEYVANEMEWLDLFTSGHWDRLIGSWFEMQQKMQDDLQFIDDARIILNRLEEPTVYTGFVTKLLEQLTKTGKDGLLAALSQEIKSSGKLLHQDGILGSLNAVNVGDQAPVLLLNDQIVNDTNLVNKKLLLLFHQSDCGNCQNEVDKLVDAYSSLQEKGIRVISISADKDLTRFKHESLTFPWKDTYCDFKGLAGVNYKSFGVMATPTFFLIGNDGVIEARTAKLEQMNL